MKTVTEAYPQLWHYTTALGLHGIVTSQQLWATNILYLNDAEEFTGFFDRKLLHLLEEGVRDGIARAMSSAERQRYIVGAGGPESLQQRVPTEMLSGLRSATLRLPTYVTSFCAPSTTNDGLLSQWRGYGIDGGYAIVFDTKGLDELLADEQLRYFYSFGHWGDVDYHNDAAIDETQHEETQHWEALVRATIARIVLEGSTEPAEELFSPILSLATRHKHRGFREEAEVRIMVVTSRDVVEEEAAARGDLRPRKQVHFQPREGVPVPYIRLFERPTSEKASLPITKIVVGPHADKLKRQRAVEMLLDQCNIKAEVVVSDIPFVGR